MSRVYSPEDIDEGKRLYELIMSVPEDKKILALMMLEAFINGLSVQQQIQATSPSA